MAGCPSCSNRFNHKPNCRFNPDNSGESFELSDSPRDEHNKQISKWVQALEFAKEKGYWSIVENVAEDIEGEKL